MAVKKENVEAVELLDDEFPALDGNVGKEIAQRSGDVHTAASDVRLKDYVVLKSEYDRDNSPEFHQRNIDGERQALINQGLRPTGDGEFIDSEDHEDGVSVVLHYSFPVEPADIATDTEVEHAHVVESDQHKAEEDGK